MKKYRSPKLPVLFTLALIVVFLLPLGLVTVGAADIGGVQYAQAETDGSYQFLEPIPGVGKKIGVDGEFSLYVKNIITLVIGFAILAAIIMIVVAGFEYLTSVSQDKTSAAKERIANAVLGLVLALASVVILQTINPQLIEINTVSTVTTSGSTLVVDGSFINNSGTPCKADDLSCYADKHCFPVISQGMINLFDKEAGYFCYQTENQCDAGQAKQTDLTEEDFRKKGEENPRERAEEEIGSCNYYHKSIGRIIDVDSGEVLEDNIIGVGPSKNEAIESCEDEVRKIGIKSPYTQCFAKGEREGGCVPRCGEPSDKPAPVPKDWNGRVWCADTDPTASNCSEEKSTCEAENGSCYQHPTSMVSGGTPSMVTSCPNCVFLSGSDYPLKPGSTCSPDGQNPNLCRINAGLSNSLAQMEGYLNPPGPSTKSLEYKITETFPPTVRHQDSCHYNGTCVDAALRKSDEEMTKMGTKSVNNHYQNTAAEATQTHVDKINDFIEAAEESGLRVEYEVGSRELMSGLIEKGVPDSKIKYIEGVSPHFSVYRN